MESPVSLGLKGRSRVTRKVRCGAQVEVLLAELHQDVLDASAHNIFGGAAIFIIFMRSYSIFTAFVETSIRSHYLFIFPFYIFKEIALVDDRNVSKF